MTTSTATPTTHTAQDKIRIADLHATVDKYAQHIKVLSLDCFDTLLWRKTAEPRDVFYDLEHKPVFKSLDFTALTRINAETFAYNMNKLKHGHKQANLSEIYQGGFPSLDSETLAALQEEELAAEMETCFAYPAVIELIRKAKAKGLKIIIVSDTYLKKSQLERLLASKLPKDVMSAIHRIYCSCDNRKGKNEGLFSDIVADLNIKANSILHIGDNIITDYAGPRKVGVNTLQLIHHEKNVTEVLRMQAVAASLMDTSIRNQRPLNNPFKGILAKHLTKDSSPESIIGYATTGPIMYAFGRFILSEVERLKSEGKRPKVLFLMRDAYLPSLACEALAGEPIGTRIRISRFSSYASTFRSEEDVDIYLANRTKSGRFEDICSQLLLPEDIANKILKKVDQAVDPAKEFSQLVHQKDILDVIFQQSAIYRKRLFKHLEKEIGLSQGDTLVFVDLGYSGTAQNRLQPIFKDELGVDIFGCYLIALRTPNWKASRRGLLDASHYDDKMLSIFPTHIGVFEQICTSTEKSVVDYDEDGNPIFSEIAVNPAQHKLLTPIHQECIRFIQDAKTFLSETRITITDQDLRDTAAHNLCRLIYLPTKSELKYLESFQFEFNVGTDEILQLFDLEKGMNSLKRRSWLYCAKENVANMRTNYPAEWRSANIELAITLMSWMRFGLEVAPNDLSHRTQKIHLIAVHNGEAMPLELEAALTFDGYYSLMAPVVAGDYKLGIQFGLNYQWVEIESAELISHFAIYSQMESAHTQDASSYLTGEDLSDKGGGLFECLSENGLIVFNRPQSLGDGNYILRVIFRPIVVRKKD